MSGQQQRMKSFKQRKRTARDRCQFKRNELRVPNNEHELHDVRSNKIINRILLNQFVDVRNICWTSKQIGGRPNNLLDVQTIVWTSKNNLDVQFVCWTSNNSVGRPTNVLDFQTFFGTSNHFGGRPQIVLDVHNLSLDVHRIVWTSNNVVGRPQTF